MQPAGRVIAIVMMIGVCLSPALANARSIDGVPTPDVTVPDTQAAAVLTNSLNVTTGGDVASTGSHGVVR